MRKFNKCEVLANGTIQVREVEILELKDGSEVEGGFHRLVYTPDMDINSIECPRCKNIAKDEWTADVVSAYKAKQAEADLPAE
jgi:hypothetical protein